MRYARASGDGPLLAYALNYYAFTLLWSNDPAAELVLGEAEAIRNVSPYRRLQLAECRAMLSMETGDLDSAAYIFAQLREAWRSAGFPLNAATAMAQLGDIELRRRNYQRAVELLYEAVSLIRNNEASAHFTSILVLLGQVLAVSGEPFAAVCPAIEAIGLSARKEPGHFHVSLAIELLVFIAAVQGDLDRSARLAGYANASITRIGFSRDYGPLAVHERLMTRLHEHLAPDELARLTTQGAALTPEAAIALARTLETSAEARAT